MRHRQLTALLAALASLIFVGCLSGTVELRHLPASARPLPAAGIHVVRFAFRVEDRRGLQDANELCANRAILRRSPLRSLRPGTEVLEQALVREFESHDLKVVEPDLPHDLLLHVELLQLTCWVDRRSGGLLRDRLKARSLIEANVSLRDGRTGEELYWFNPRAEGEHRELTLLYTNGPYVGAMEQALALFAGRIVRRPQILIAAQRMN